MMRQRNFLDVTPQGYFWGLFFLVILVSSCKMAREEDRTVRVETYTHEDLDYPSKPKSIPQTAQQAFIDNFYFPWNQKAEALLNSLEDFPGKELSYLETYLADDEWYGENKKPHKKWQRQHLVNNANTKTFPNFLRKGITITHTNLRRLPTDRPGFDTYSKAGEGYPFDYFQETNLWANTPLQILHLSTDKQWCYVISPYYKGWLTTKDIGLVSDDFRKQWLTGSYAIPLSDEVSLQNSNSHYAIKAKMGMVLPYQEIPNNAEYVLGYYANTDENQNARILKAEVDKDYLAFNNHEFSGEHLKQLVSQLVGRPYGWGGYLENRDCSSMIRDLLATYKIWLPRDSKDQIEVGEHFELTGSVEEKIQIIKEKGIPFLTILRKKGHNMLYVNDGPNGEPLILHAIWGLKTSYSNEQLADFLETYPIEGIHKDEDGRLKGRYIIGEAVITSVTAGSGNGEITIPLLEEIYAMTNILEP